MGILDRSSLSVLFLTAAFGWGAGCSVLTDMDDLKGFSTIEATDGTDDTDEPILGAVCDADEVCGRGAACPRVFNETIGLPDGYTEEESYCYLSCETDPEICSPPEPLCMMGQFCTGVVQIEGDFSCRSSEARILNDSEVMLTFSNRDENMILGSCEIVRIDERTHAAVFLKLLGTGRARQLEIFFESSEVKTGLITDAFGVLHDVEFESDGDGKVRKLSDRALGIFLPGSGAFSINIAAAEIFRGRVDMKGNVYEAQLEI